MIINYKECFFKSFKGIWYGLATIIMSLAICYAIFGKDGYLYEISQYANINNLIIRSIFSMITFIIILFVKEVDIRSEEIKKELSFKKYFLYKMFGPIIYIIYSISSFFIIDKFINDKYFVVTFLVVVSLFGFIYIIVSSVYKIILEKKINKQLKEINKRNLN